jgi:4-amino-4-deoxy-L-arabinose transferase-like glycosyltransferase
MASSTSLSHYDLAAIGLFIIGIALRVYGITFNSLWLDEISTYMYSSKSFLGIWEAMLLGEYNPPLFYWIEHTMMLLFGISDLILRIAPAIFGIITIPAIYILGKRVYDAPTGIIAAMLMTFSPWGIVYSQEARAYTMIVFLATLALIYYFGDEKNDKLIMAAILGIALWTHFYTIIFAIILLITDLIHRYSASRTWPFFDVKPIALYAIMASPLVIGAYGLIGPRFNIGVNFGLTGINLIIQTIYQFFGFSYIGIALFLLAMLGIWLLYKKNKYNSIVLFLVIFVTIVVSIPLAYKMIIVPRYFCFVIPALFVSIGCFHDIINIDYGRKKSNFMAYFVILTFIALLSPSFVSLYKIPIKPDYRSAAEYIYENANGSKVVFVPDYPAPFTFYYKGDVERIRNVSDIYIKTGDVYVVSMIDVDWHPNETELRSWLNTNTTLLKAFQFVEVRRYNGTIS